MSARFGLRAAQGFRSQPTMAFRQNFRFSQRRYQSTAEAAADATKSENTGFAKLWNSPVGPKTVHFWAPIMKWGLVLAGAADFARPADQLSLSQNAALMATGLIWTRWCFIIKPRNLFLASVNFLLFCVGTTQVSRVLSHRRSVNNETVGEQVEGVAKDAKAKLEHVVEDPKAALKGK